MQSDPNPLPPSPIFFDQGNLNLNLFSEDSAKEDFPEKATSNDNDDIINKRNDSFIGKSGRELEMDQMQLMIEGNEVFIEKKSEDEMEAMFDSEDSLKKLCLESESKEDSGVSAGQLEDAQEVIRKEREDYDVWRRGRLKVHTNFDQIFREFRFFQKNCKAEDDGRSIYVCCFLCIELFAY